VLSLRQRLQETADRLWSDRPGGERRRFEQALAQLRASGALGEAVQPGEMVPDFSLRNATGETVHLQALLDSGPLVLVFFLSAQCRLCRQALSAYHHELNAAAAPRHGGFVCVSLQPAADAVAHLAGVDAGQRLAGSMLGDPGGRVCRLFGLLYAPSSEVRAGFRQLGLPSWLLDGDGQSLPLVATYVVDVDGIAAFAEIDADPGRRAEPALLLDALRGLQATTPAR
jgi:peroxiredoxin